VHSKIDTRPTLVQVSNSFVKKNLGKYYNTFFVFYVDLFMTKIASSSSMGGSVFFIAKFDQNAQNKNSQEYFVAIFCFLGEKGIKN
jgi:hypothetical protein